MTTTSSSSGTRSSPRTRRASGPPTATRPATASRRSTSSTCATGRAGPAGTRRRRRRRSRPTWSRAPARGTSRPTRRSPASRSRPGSIGPLREAARPRSPQGRDPRSAGHRGRARTPGAGLRGRRQRPRGPHDRARRRGRLPARRPLPEAAREPADRGLRDRACMRFGVVQFPGSCDEVDALAACRRVGDAVLLWHGDHDLQGVDAIVVPGGFSYGDYLRVGAIARFSPVMQEVAAFARDGGPVLGICNGFQVLCEAGLLPGALLPNASLRFSMRQTEIQVQRTNCLWTRACDEGELLSIPAKHTTGRFYAPGPVLEEMEANGQVVVRYVADPIPNGSLTSIAGVCNNAGNVLGLMPHPEHAVDELTCSADGLKLFASVAAGVAA